MTEHDQQAALFAYLRMMESRYPVLKWIHAIPNGAWFQGNWGLINKTIAEGLTKGVWDIFVPVPVDDKAGLYIEMKFGSGKLRDEQVQFQADVGDAYQWAICYSWIEACHAIGEYLGIEELRNIS